MSDRQFDITPAFIGWIVFGAVMSLLGLLPYFKSLQLDDAHNVVPFFEFTPVFLVILAFLVRGETLDFVQLAGAFLIIACGFLFSWDFKNGHVRGKVLGLMALASFLYALYQLSLRSAAQYADDWGVCGSLLLLESIFGVALFLSHKKARLSIIETARATKGHSILLALVTNSLGVAGVVCIIAAFRHAPVMGYVLALSGVQPFFSFFLALALKKSFPSHFQGIIFDRDTKIKLFLLLGIFAGIYLLVMG